MNGIKYEDMTGQQHGSWVVIRKLDSTQIKYAINNGYATWLCRCAGCGDEKEIVGRRLRVKKPKCVKCKAAERMAEDHKVCSKCGDVKERSQFPRHSRICLSCKKAYMSEYKKVKNSAINVAKRAWWKKNAASGRLSRKKWHLKSKYGLTLEQYTKMFQDQSNSCAICKKPEKIEGIRLAVDHCKITGKVRGLLCFECNVGIGKLKDSPEILESALAYLRR